MVEEKNVFSKIFLWMFIGLAITFGVAFYCAQNENMVYNIFSKYYWILIILELVVVFTLSARIRKMNPMTAKLMFALYSFITGLTFCSIFIIYELTSIVYVFGITSILFLIFGLMGYFTKLDLTKIGTYLFMGLIGVIILSIINIFVASETFNMTISIICLVIFLAYVAYDINKIKRNLPFFNSSENLAIYGALELYLDFINIFIRLLQLFGRSRD